MTSSLSRQLAARIERWPIAGSFTISRGAKTEAVTVVAEVSHGGHDRARRMRALSPLRRDPGSDAGRPRGDAGTACARARSAGPAGRDAAGAARNALDCALLDLEAKTQRPAGLDPARPAGAAPLHHRLHDLAGHAGGDGGGDRQGRAPAAAQDQARRRRRRRADRGRAQGRARIRADRRRQRGLDAGQSRAEPRACAEPA